MINQQKTDIEKLESINMILLSGQYNSLFNDLVLTPPAIFHTYSDNLHRRKIMRETNNKLTKLRPDYGREYWDFHQLIQTIAPGTPRYNFADTIDFIKSCGIDPEHIAFKRIPNPQGTLFPGMSIFIETQEILLSRHGARLVTQKFIEQENTLTRDINADILSRRPDTVSHDNEMRAIFANFFFAADENDRFPDIRRNADCYTRGIQLRIPYNEVMEDFRKAAMFFLLDEKKDMRKFHSDLEKFKQDYIFDILFKNNGKSFKDKYESALKSFGYDAPSALKDKNKWTKNGIEAPVYPGAYFAPELSFFITWVMNKFVETLNHEKSKHRITDKQQWFRNITIRYFTTVRDGMNSVMPDFVKNPPFDILHQYEEAYKNIAEIEKKYAEKIKPINHKDDIDCMDEIKKSSVALTDLFLKYKKNPTKELVDKIIEIENKIRESCCLIYGYNFQGFVNVRTKLNSQGEFVRRELVESDTPIQITPRARQSNTKTEQLSIFDSVFQVLPDDKITLPKLLAVTAEPYTNKHNKLAYDWHFDPNGIYQAVNPLVTDRQLIMRNIHGQMQPSRVRDNFQLCNFCVESDTMPVEDQRKLAQLLVNLGIARQVVESGNKSIHILITVKDVPKNLEEYQWLFHHIGIKLGLIRRTWNSKNLEYDYSGDIDMSYRNPGQSMRRGGAMREISNEDGTTKLVEQKLLHNSNTVYDIKWRDAYIIDMANIRNKRDAMQYNIKPEQPFYNDKKDIDGFMKNYATNNSSKNIDLTFAERNGHNSGVILIGAAKKRGFSESEIDEWLRKNCDRYHELYDGWRSLLKGTGRQRYG